MRILNLRGRLVDGEGDKRGDFGGHHGHKIVSLGLALPRIDHLNIGLVLSVREGGIRRPDRAGLRSNPAS